MDKFGICKTSHLRAIVEPTAKESFYMIPVLMVDIDGTVADCNHRRHHIRNGSRNWDAFFATMHLDPLIESVAKLVRLVASTGTPIIFTTGRGEEYRVKTETWLIHNDLPFYKVYMRPLGDKRADHVVKIELLDNIRADGLEPILVIDDRQSVVDSWRKNGLTCLQACDWDESKALSGTQLVIMVGPSGSGKSTLVDRWIANKNITKGSVISTDDIRQDLCGDFREQNRNDDVFASAHSMIKTRLGHGLLTIYDATNIRKKDRMAAAKLGLPNAKVFYYVINRSLESKKAMGGWRNGVIASGGKELIDAHEMTFNSQIKDILSGDGLNVKVIDARGDGCMTLNHWNLIDAPGAQV